MHHGRLTLAIERFQEIELVLCLRCNCVAGPRIGRFFGVVSRLGDGTFWLAMVPLLLLLVSHPWVALGHLATVVVCCAITYKAIKHWTARPRPYHARVDIRALAQPLDRYSFPSGHTMHAVACSILLVHHVPLLAWVVVPFTVLVALSRVLLGLHYPTDVIAGATLGAALAGISLGYV